MPLIVQAFNSITPGAIVVSLVSLLVLIFWVRPAVRRFTWTTYIPAPLIVVVLGISLNMVFLNFFPYFEIQESHLVNLGGFDGLSSLSSVIAFPDLAGLTNPRVYQLAVTIALVASIESLLSVEATDKLDLYRRITPLNAELKAQGTANIVSGLLGGRCTVSKILVCRSLSRPSACMV